MLFLAAQAKRTKLPEEARKVENILAERSPFAGIDLIKKVGQAMRVAVMCARSGATRGVDQLVKQHAPQLRRGKGGFHHDAAKESHVHVVAVLTVTRAAGDVDRRLSRERNEIVVQARVDVCEHLLGNVDGGLCFLRDVGRPVTARTWPR